MSRQERKSIFFTSDLHLLHRNSIEFDNRPFKDVHHMTESLIKNYNSVVPENGLCYFLGDIGIGKHGDLDKIIPRLNGTKVLIKGNHDGSDTSMYRMGFDVVLNKAVIYIAGEEVALTHCPLRGIKREDTSDMRGTDTNEDYHGSSRDTHKKLSFEDHGQFCLHGHLHAPKEKNKSTLKQDRQWDIGIVGNNYRPVSYSQVEKWIQETLYKEKWSAK